MKEAVASAQYGEQHRAAQAQGRAEILKTCRIRVASVLRDYSARATASAAR